MPTAAVPPLAPCVCVQNAQALRLAAQALLEGALCTLPADAREARSQLKVCVALVDVVDEAPWLM